MHKKSFSLPTAYFAFAIFTVPTAYLVLASAMSHEPPYNISTSPLSIS